MQNFREKNVFHEIKNQISVCDLYTEVIARTLRKKEIKDETINRAIENIKLSLSLIADCATSLRETKFQELNLENLVNEGIALSKSYGKTEFLNNILPDTKITADKNKFLSVLINIFKNAIEAGATQIKVYGDKNSINIENNGTSIPIELQSKIFDDGFTTKSNGTGLGLLLTQKILNEQNFKIKLIKSEQNVTKFNISPV